MDRKFIYRYVITLLMLACVFGGKAQLTLTLERTITLAADSSLPISNVKSSGTIPNIVVNDVMMIGRRRRRPASCMASIRGTPSLRSSLLQETFKLGCQDEIHQQDRNEQNHDQLVQHLPVGKETS